ncbi:MAG: hypothetical protein ACOY4O_12550 [Pseudomonadota bacterium]
MKIVTWLLIVLAALAIAFYFPFTSYPPLLKGVSAGGEWDNGCPPIGAERQRNLGRSLSPELNGFLNHRFAEGSPAKPLAEGLAMQGFRELASPCPNDSSIRAMTYTGKTHWLSLVETTATIYFRSTDGKLDWIKAFVSYTTL